jgi:mycofactocin system transcriptional regulator
LPSPPATTHAEVAHVALALFARDGFEATTMDDVAAAVGVGRRTLFRYYASKNDLVWGEFDRVMEALRAHLDSAGAAPPLTALRRAIVAANRYAPAELPTLRIRMRLIGAVPALQGHALRRYGEWRGIVTEYAARRRGERPEDLVPQLIGHAALGTTMAAFQWWVEHGDGDPAEVIDAALAQLEAGFP